ncbi:hypothetical protein [Erwinia typographi]|uniref:hypothetical protein n=1 Tax=Erwinia typographi TaxID=371042 RepID=UPI00069148AC|nr:hypothetical protein [Erwinia typographi]
MKNIRQVTAFQHEGMRVLSGNQLRHIVAEEQAEYLVIDVNHLKPAHAAANQKRELRKKLEEMVNNPSLDPGVGLALLQLAQRWLQPTSEASKPSLFDGFPAYQQRNAQREQELRAFILEDTHWLSSSELSDRAHFTNANRSAGPNAWKRRGRTFAITVEGHDRYPKYAFDEAWQPLPVIKRILEIFAGTRTPWSLAIWFGTGNGWLAGEKPKDLLERAPDRVAEAARQAKEGAQHG